MCGIAGILRVYSSSSELPDHRFTIEERWLDILDDAIGARGPDGDGRFRDRVIRDDGRIADLALVHRRLAVLDPRGGAQPMLRGIDPSRVYRAGHPPALPPTPGRERTGSAIVFNGCLYNHRELRHELQREGFEFFSDHCDTEALLHACEKWEVGVRAHLDGMYAAAIWDAQRAELNLIRDSRGEKPLYVLTQPHYELLIFASTAAGVARCAAAMNIQLDLDPDALAEWIALGYDGVHTPWKQIHQLAPGTWLGEHGWSCHEPEYRFGPKDHADSLRTSWGFQGAVTQADRVLQRAVESRLESDVPLGCFLSGGVDSSLVAHYARRSLGSLTTLCVRMPAGVYDESEHARAVAQHLGTDHHEIDVDTDPVSDLVRLVEWLGLPFGDSSLLPTHWVSRAASDHVRVALTGDGGDEQFLGYERYFAPRHFGAASFLARLGLGRFLRRTDPKAKSDKLARLLHASDDRSYRGLLAIHQAPDLEILLGQAAHSVEWADRVRGPRQAQHYDLDRHLPGDMLRKVDSASMIAGLETRAPFLAPGVGAFSEGLSTSTLLGPDGRTRKGVLRALARRHLPAAVVDRPKMGFAIPVGDWFRDPQSSLHDLLRDHLLSPEPFPGLESAGLAIRSEAITRMLDEHTAAPRGYPGRDHSQRLYALLALSIWCRWWQRVSGIGRPIA